MKQPIAMLTKRFGYFPETFLLDSHLLKVTAVILSSSPSGRKPEMCFTVKCDDGNTYDLKHNVNSREWFVTRVRQENNAKVTA